MLDSYSDIKTSFITNREIPRNQMYKKLSLFFLNIHTWYIILFSIAYIFSIFSLQDGDDNEFAILKMDDDLYKIRVKKVTMEYKKDIVLFLTRMWLSGRKTFSFWILYSRGDVCTFSIKVLIEYKIQNLKVLIKYKIQYFP